MTQKRKKKSVGSNSKKVLPERNLLDMQQTDGKSYNKYNVNSIDELLGEKHLKYTHKTVDEYRSYLDDLNVSDLQAHAAKLGIMPNYDRSVLTKRLIREYEMTSSQYFGAIIEGDSNNNPVSDEVMKILSEGR